MNNKECLEHLYYRILKQGFYVKKQHANYNIDLGFDFLYNMTEKILLVREEEDD